MAFPPLGQPAPPFSLLNQDGQPVNLHDIQASWVVIYFYPKALTPGCTLQACGIRDQAEALAQRQVRVLGISPDPPERLKKFVTKEKLNFTLLSDPDHQVAEAYGVWGPKKFMGREYVGVHRVSFILDEQFRLRHILSKVNTKTHARDILAWIDQQMRSNGSGI